MVILARLSQWSKIFAFVKSKFIMQKAVGLVRGENNIDKHFSETRSEIKSRVDRDFLNQRIQVTLGTRHTKFEHVLNQMI